MLLVEPLPPPPVTEELSEPSGELKQGEEGSLGSIFTVGSPGEVGDRLGFPPLFPTRLAFSWLMME